MKTAFTTMTRVMIITLLLITILGPNVSQPTIAYATPSVACHGFSDVPSHYYACFALDQLVTANVVAGYTDPTCSQKGVPSPCFLPQNAVTRAQFSKIVSSLFGYNYLCSPTCSQHFTDVPVGSTFFTYIESLYRAGIISGYGADVCNAYPYYIAAPCFLPGNPVSRQQMAKIISNSAGFSDNTSGRPATFADVAPGNTFFDYVERLVIHSANGPFPPDVTLPSCSSSTQPCFYPGTNAPRIDTIYHSYRSYVIKVNLQQGYS
ncbi:MAG: S-layer homology domain-containing protein, partial [Chloroflexota bacterium]|nr:S-layer homology domain-containing protein [Chloroflexota bacterium]